MISVKIDDTKLQATLSAMPAKIRASVYKTVFSLALQMERYIKQDKLQGQVLNHRSGNLQRSIQSQVIQGDTFVRGRVFSSGDVKYAAIHEYGGRIPAHIIYPKNAEALSFMMNGKRVFAKYVNHPGSQMPERSFMRSTLRDFRGQITEGLAKAVADAVKI